MTRLGKTLGILFRFAPLAAGCAFAGPDDVALVSLTNAYSRPPSNQASDMNWILVGSPALKVGAADNSCCRYQGDFTRNDSLEHVTLQIEASRSFTVDMRIYTNLGEFVDRLSFTVPQAQFEKLAPGSRSNTRTMRVLWDNRTAQGRLAGTGAYVVKTAVTLNRVPGMADGAMMHTDYRIVGLLRSL